jgi:hypothetical protein
MLQIRTMQNSKRHSFVDTTGVNYGQSTIEYDYFRVVAILNPPEGVQP